MAFPWGAVVGAGASLAGAGLSFLGGQQALGQNAAQNAVSQGDFEQQMNLAEAQLQFNENAATSGIQWRVNDAKAAGISPLVALGAPTFSPSAVSVGGPSFGGYDNPNAGAGSALSGMGQDISRAAMAAQSENTRMQTILGAEKIRADAMASTGEADKNAAMAGYYRALTDRVSGAQIGPGIPAPGSAHFVEGQGTPVGTVKVDPSKVISDAGSSHSAEAGITPGIKVVRMPDGGLDPQPSLNTSVGATGETVGWTIRNRLSPPSGYHVGWNGAWYPDAGSHWYDRPFGTVGGAADYSRLGGAMTGGFASP